MVMVTNNSIHKKKGAKFLGKRLYILVTKVVPFIIVLALIAYCFLLGNIKGSTLMFKLNIYSIIVGIVIGFFLAIFSIKIFEDIKIKDKRTRVCKNQAKIFLADIQRCERVFKNKRFDLMRISSITIIKNWLHAFNYISSELNDEEVNQLVNYYSKIDKLVEYEKRINFHLEAMQYTVLKEYPHMKEYKELIALFTFEVNSLFKIDISLLVKKLNLMLS